MKKRVTILMMLFVCIVYSQTKKNGIIYSEHPAIDVVEAFQKAFIEGDTAKVASYLADNYKSFNGSSTNPDSKGTDKKGAILNAKFWKKNIAYLSMERTNGAYPDALEYKDNNDNNVVWVQTWDDLKGVHNTTGVKVNMPVHRLYVVNEDNKITRMFNYGNDAVFQGVRNSFSTRKNGVLYNEHKYINKVRRMMAAFENKDLEKAYSYFREDVSISNIEMGLGESIGLEEMKAGHQEFYKNYDVESIDVVGYPDGLEYEIGGNGFTVQSWWNFRLVRKSDSKKIVMPAMYTHDFDDDGMIVRSIGYFSTKVLDAK